MMKDYYHMSPKQFEVGQKIEGNGKEKVAGLIEEGFELLKPKGFLSRKDAVFTHSSLDFSESGLMCECYIYQVKLPENVQKHDLGWITPLQLSLLKIKHNLIGMADYPDWSDELLKDSAHNYWNGVSSNKPNWEYIAPYMIIEKKLSEEKIEPKDTKGGWKK